MPGWFQAAGQACRASEGLRELGSSGQMQSPGPTMGHLCFDLTPLSAEGAGGATQCPVDATGPGGPLGTWMVCVREAGWPMQGKGEGAGERGGLDSAGL